MIFFLALHSVVQERTFWPQYYVIKVHDAAVLPHVAHYTVWMFKKKKQQFVVMEEDQY